MNRTDLLASTRAEFLRSFEEGIAATVPQSLQGLFEKADRSPTSIVQRRYLDARIFLQNRSDDLQLQAKKSMDKLLNRSFQTTYSNYRPAFPTSILDGSISLVDTSAFEDELRFNEIIDRFRNEAGEQLRDLNIRIALLFEQDNIKERENPFRPYLFSSAISTAVDAFGTNPDLSAVLTQQLADSFSAHVATIYEVINKHLAEHGIAAQLLLKPKKTASRARPSQNADDDADSDQENISSTANAQDSSAANMSGRSRRNMDKPEISAAAPWNPVEKLLKTVKVMATRSQRADSAATFGSDNYPEASTFTGGGAAGGNFGGANPDGMPPGGWNNGATYSGGMHGSNNAGGASTGAPGVGGDAYRGTGGVPGMAGGAFGEAGGAPGMAEDAYGGTGSWPGMGGYGQGHTEPNGSTESNGSSRAGGGGRSGTSWLSGKQVVGDVLRKFFSSGSMPEEFSSHVSDQIGDDSRNGQAAYGQLASTVQTLLKQNTPSTEEMYSNSGEIRNLIMERRSNLIDTAQDLKEQMTIDIVSMLFEFILRDTQVPAEVRAQLGRLQFLVLKVALRDNSLLTQKAHPARMLVNRIGSISLGLNQIDPSGANVTAEISRIVSEMLADETESPGLFSKMLDDLDSFIARELLVNDKNVSTAVEAVEQAESRTLRFAHMTAQMSEAISGLHINEHLQHFFENDWARAIELAERTNSSLATQYRLLVPDLLWSVLPKSTEEDRQQLLALLPIMLKTIHEGMNAAGWEASDKQTLMDWLFEAHTVVLRGSTSNEPISSLASIHEHFKRFVDNTEMLPQTTYSSETPAGRRKFLEEAMRELDVRIQLLDKLFDQDEDSPDELGPDIDAAHAGVDIAERLRIGVGIEVNLGGKASIGRLNWINPSASNLVLTLNDQAEPSVISVRMFRRMLKNDRVRFLEAEPIFERAVESLLISANQV